MTKKLEAYVLQLDISCQIYGIGLGWKNMCMFSVKPQCLVVV